MKERGKRRRWLSSVIKIYIRILIACAHAAVKAFRGPGEFGNVIADLIYGFFESCSDRICWQKLRRTM